MHLFLQQIVLGVSYYHDVGQISNPNPSHYRPVLILFKSYSLKNIQLRLEFDFS